MFARQIGLKNEKKTRHFAHMNFRSKVSVKTQVVVYICTCSPCWSPRDELFH